ncbi:siderophore-interacting protein [Caulobacter mirabilis]|uniref:NADPH-dependent ferric siderophore reductase n=1 Tax=Caulobacter mirabilis TaxID=69666 RepID=A0A2D2B196_9CAUL|nr:siderophore-interacting protein [Caulobacter mirabilis]ATQ44041.1 NADPH-dependent ferric siderophore reductase [Caulobacter mirabilis]
MSPKPARPRYAAEVVDVRPITPHMRRITLAGEGLRLLGIDRPAQWVKLFFPGQEGVARIGRAYTVRGFSHAFAAMDVDFVLHGDDGPASRWAARAERGEMLDVAGPRGGHAIDPRAKNYILVGDATALPAICAIVEALPAHVRARLFIEVANKAEEQRLRSNAALDVQWLHSGAEAPGATGRLELAVQAADLDTRNCQAWIAGESFMVRSVRTHLTVDRGVPEHALDSQGYWKLGVADARG